MNFRRVLGLALLIVGIVLLVYGVSSMQHVSEKLVESVQGHPTDKTTWYFIGGIVLIIVGGGMTFMRRKF